MNIVVSGLDVVIYPSLDGMNYKSDCQLKVDDYIFPQEWGIDDWDRVKMNSVICFTGKFELSGKVVDSFFKEEPYIVLSDVTFRGKEQHLVTPEHLECFGYYFIKEESFKRVKVKPLWLFPPDFEFTWETYKTIKDVGNWHPFRPLSLAEIRKCIWICYPDEVSWNKSQWIELIEQGYFALSLEVRRVHNALRMADKIYSNGWPKVEQEFLALWFNLDLESTQWIWALPGSIIADRIGLYGIYISKDEFEPKTLLRKLLHPNIEPFYKAKSLYGTNSPA